jgi:hypothetical protein
MLDDVNWPKAFLGFVIVAALTFTINSCIRMEYEGNMKLMEQGIYGLDPEQAAEIILEKERNNDND